MNKRHPSVIHTDELPWTSVRERIAGFSPMDKGRGERFGVRVKRLGQAAGGSQLGTSLCELPPGARSWPFHYHLVNEEAIYVLEGEGTLRLGKSEVAVR